MDKISYNAQRGCKKLSSFFKKVTNSEEDEEEDDDKKEKPEDEFMNAQPIKDGKIDYA